MTANDRAVSEVLGTVLILGLVIGVSGVLVATGGGLVTDTRTQTGLQHAETQMAGFDTVASDVGYGDADHGRFDFAFATGGMRVDDDAGWIRITHQNYDGSADEVVLNESLGAVVYRTDSGEVAYQNGGVFRYEGGSTLVSPPELHYREQTLTLPLLQVEGSGGGTRTVGALVQSEGATARERVFPDAGQTYDDGSTPYRNPIAGGTVTMTVHSRYYEAWASYFRTHDVGTVVGVDPDARTVRVSVTSGGTYGDFQMPGDGRAIDVVGYTDGHSLETLSLTLRPDDEDNANFANLDWALTATEDGRELTLRFESGSGGKPCDGGEIDVSFTVDSPDGSERVWEEEDAFTENGTDLSYSCAGGTPTLRADLTGAAELEYVDGPDPVTLEGHDDHGEPATFDHGDPTSLDHLLNHYLAEMGRTVDLTVQDSGNGPARSASGSVDESRSAGVLEYDRSNIVTYLRVTKAEITVEME